MATKEYLIRDGPNFISKEYLISDGPILTEDGVLYRTQIVRSCFCCRRRTLTGRLSSLTVYWCEHWPRRLLRTEWRWIMIQSGNVQYTYTKRFACFFRSQCFWRRGAFLPSQLLSQLIADEARYCWVSVSDDKARFCRVSFAESDRQFIDVDIDRDGCWGTAWRWVAIFLLPASALVCLNYVY